MSTLKNTSQSYGWLAIAIHWVFAFTVFGLFGLGLYMVELTYYDPWYRGSLDLHKSIGVVLFAVLLFRVFWGVINIQPTPEPGKAWEHFIASAVHGLLYLLPLMLMMSGYLISTADGRAIEVFGLFSIPALPESLDVLYVRSIEDFHGDLHELLAWSLIGLAGLHAAAALKHHFIEKNRTLTRMLGIKN